MLPLLTFGPAVAAAAADAHVSCCVSRHPFPNRISAVKKKRGERKRYESEEGGREISPAVWVSCCPLVFPLSSFFSLMNLEKGDEQQVSRS